MQLARIAELLEPFLGPANDRRLTGTDLEHISTYIDLLLRWNARVNLTAVRTPEEIVTRHFGESFFAASCLFAGSSARTLGRGISVADVGSGAGFPGFPMKLWAPSISLSLIESNHKKAVFLREVIRALGLANVNVQTSRAESLAGADYQLVTIRAVERFASILPAAANLVALTGRLALLIGSAQLDQARSLLPQFAWSQPEHVPLSRSKILAIASRTWAAQNRLPRGHGPNSTTVGNSH